MDIQDHVTQPASHYERVVLKENDRNSLIQQIKKNAFGYMDNLEGWCTKNKASLLIDLVFMIEPKNVVEIGVFGGKSLIPVAAALKMSGDGTGLIFGIDPWDSLESIEGMDGVNRDWWGQLDHAKILRGLEARIHEYALEDQVVLIKSTSEQAPLIENIDMLHIDGNHSEKAAMLDVLKWVPQVRKGGVIIFDDVTWGSNGTAVQWLDENCIRLVEFHESSDWAIWIKP